MSKLKYTIITMMPTSQGLLGPIPEKNIVEEGEAENIEELVRRLHVSLNGKCLVVESDQIQVVESRIVNEIRGMR